MATVDKKVINISKDSDYAIGRMLVRGYSNGEAFHSKLLDTKVGNVRNAISYLSREGMTKEMLAKTKLTKKDMAKVVDFPKKRVDGYNAKLKSICIDRILAEKKLMIELIKFLDKEFTKLLKLSEENYEEVIKLINFSEEPSKFVDMVASFAITDEKLKQEVLETVQLTKRIEKVLERIKIEISIAKI